MESHSGAQPPTEQLLHHLVGHSLLSALRMSNTIILATRNGAIVSQQGFVVVTLSCVLTVKIRKGIESHISCSELRVFVTKSIQNCHEQLAVPMIVPLDCPYS